MLDVMIIKGPQCPGLENEKIKINER